VLTLESREPGANPTKKSCSQPVKQVEQSDSTEAGMQIDGSDEQSANAQSAKTVTRETGSNVTDKRASQPPKHWAEMAVTG
jgi:hypothetical protein